MYLNIAHKIKQTCSHVVLHCKETIPKIRNKYFQKRNCPAAVPKFPQSCVCKRFIHSHHRINHSQIHECGNWDWGRAIPFLGTHKGNFRCSVRPYDPSTIREHQRRKDTLPCVSSKAAYSPPAEILKKIGDPSESQAFLLAQREKFSVLYNFDNKGHQTRKTDI